MAKKQAPMKDFFKYNSITTPDFTHAAFCLAAEIMVVRHAAENGDELPPYFWRKDIPCDNKYKLEYNNNIQCMRKLMKDVPAHFVIQCVTYARQIKHSNYGYITTTVKNKWEKWNNNMASRISNIVKEQAVRDVAIEEMMIMASADVKYEETKGKKRKAVL